MSIKNKHIILSMKYLENKKKSIKKSIKIPSNKKLMPKQDSLDKILCKKELIIQQEPLLDVLLI